MPVNIHPETGIAYGVISGRNAPYLYEEIMAHGTDETYEQQQADARGTLEGICANFDADEVPGGTKQERIDAVVGALRDVLEKQLYASKEESQELADRFIQFVDTDSMTFDIDEVVSDLMEALHDFEHFGGDGGEHDYAYTTGPFKYRLGYLGGAALIWVMESPFVTYCRTCSPCVPNAGDLDNACEVELANNIAYCPGPDDWCSEDNKDNWPAGVWRLSSAGGPGEQVWFRPVEKTDE